MLICKVVKVFYVIKLYFIDKKLTNPSSILATKVIMIPHLNIKKQGNVELVI